MGSLERDRGGRCDRAVLPCGPRRGRVQQKRHHVQRPWCPYCRQVRAILARNHIRYSILDATTPQVQAVMLKRVGDTAVPRTIIGGVLVEGVDEAGRIGSTAAKDLPLSQTEREVSTTPACRVSGKGVVGSSMGNKERLKGILERMAAAAERERLDRRGSIRQSRKSKIR